MLAPKHWAPSRRPLDPNRTIGYSNGEFAAKMLPAAQSNSLEGVGHYDFLSECTVAGRAVLDLCKTAVAAERTHQRAIDRALAFLASVIGRPQTADR